MPDDNTNDPNDPTANDLNIPSNPQINDEEGNQGSMPDPEMVDKEDTLEEAQDMGLYTNADEEHPAELNIAEQVQNAEDQHKDNN